MAELSISTTVPEVSGDQPTPTDIVTDFVVQDTVTSVTTTETVADSTISEITAVSASIPDISVSAESVGGVSSPTSTLFTRGLDQVSLTETFSIAATYRKIFTEQQSASDNYRVVYFGKVFADTLPFTDVVAKYYRKTTGDVFAVQDNTALQPRKVVLDQVTRADQALLTPGKVTHETVLPSDTYSYLINYNRVFTDYIDATDDFFGEANIDDDQTARFGKNTVDYAHTQSTYSVSFSTTKSDSYSTIDTTALSLTKPFFNVAVSGDTNQYSFGKVVQDTNLVTDLNLKTVEKVLQHDVVQQDTSSVLVDKQLAELGSVADLHTISVSKLLANSFTSYDSVTTVLNSARIFTDTGFTTDSSAFSFATIKQDIARATDSAGKTTTKPFTSEFNLSDSFSYTVAYNRTFQDIVNSTDDFFGEANIDDDQVARFGKNVVESLLLNESASFDISITRSDTYSVSDPIYISTGKILASEFNNSDSASLTINKQSVEVTYLTESLALSASKLLLDASNTSEAISKTTAKKLADSFANTDIYSAEVDKLLTSPITNSELTSFYATKQLLDTIATPEAVVVSTNKSLSDTATQSDTVSKASTKQALDVFASTEISYINAGKVTSDILYTADVLTFLKYTGPVLYENISVADSGFINNQSYFAGTYVEPGYVGTNTNFT